MVRNALSNQPPAFLSSKPEGISEGKLPPIEKAPKRIPDPVKALGAGFLGGAGGLANLPIRGGKYVSNKVFNTDFDTSKGFFPATDYYLKSFDVQDPEAFSTRVGKGIGEFAGGDAVIGAATSGLGLGLGVLGRSATQLSKYPRIAKSLNRAGEFLTGLSKSRSVARAGVDATVAGTTQASLDSFTALPEAAKIPIFFAVTAGTGALLNRGGAKLAEQRLFARSKNAYEQANRAGSNTSFYSRNSLTKRRIKQVEDALAPIRVNNSPEAKDIANSFDKVLRELRKKKQVSSRTLLEGDRSINRALFSKDVPNNLKSVGIGANSLMRESFLKRSMPSNAYNLLRKGNSLASTAYDIRGANGKVLRTMAKLPIKFSTKALTYMIGGFPAVKGLALGATAYNVGRAAKYGRELSKIYQKSPEFREAMFNLYSHALRGASTATLTRLANRADRAAGYNEKPDFLNNAPPAFLRGEDDDNVRQKR